MKLGAGVSWADPERGISAELRGCTLLTHADEDFQEHDLAVPFAWDPTSFKGGPSLSVSHAMGATVSGGLESRLLPHPFGHPPCKPGSRGTTALEPTV